MSLSVSQCNVTVSLTMSQCHSTSRLATLSVTVSLYQLQEEEELLKQYSGRHSVSGHFTRDARSLLPPTLLLRLLKPAPPIFPQLKSPVAEQRAGEGGEEGLGAAGVGGAGVPGSTALRGHLACQAFPGEERWRLVAWGEEGACSVSAVMSRAHSWIGLCWIMCMCTVQLGHCIVHIAHMSLILIYWIG